MDVNLIDDSETVITKGRGFNRNEKIKYILELLWIFLQYLWIHRWRILIAVTLFINICAFLRLRNVRITIPTKEESYKNFGNFEIRLKKIAYANILKCADFSCRNGYCYCCVTLYKFWKAASGACNKLSPGYSSLAEGKDALDYIKNVKGSIGKTYWVGAYINFNIECAWTSGKRFCNNSVHSLIKKCLYVQDHKVHITFCGVRFSESFYPLCMKTSIDYNNSSECRHYKCSSKFCYCILRETVYSWKNALITCQFSNYFLAYFSDKDEQEFVLSLFSSLKLVIGAKLSIGKPLQLQWYNSEKGIALKDVAFEQNLTFACYYARNGRMYHTPNCYLRRKFVCQIKEAANTRKSYTFSKWQKARLELGIKECSTYFCIESSKCYCITKFKRPWGNCKLLLGENWSLTSLSSDEERKAIVTNFHSNNIHNLWLGYSNFVSKLNPRWIDGDGLEVNLTSYSNTINPSCLLLCGENFDAFCFVNCNREYKSLCSISYSKALSWYKFTTTDIIEMDEFHGYHPSLA